MWKTEKMNHMQEFRITVIEKMNCSKYHRTCYPTATHPSFISRVTLEIQRIMFKGWAWVCVCVHLLECAHVHMLFVLSCTHAIMSCVLKCVHLFICVCVCTCECAFTCVHVVISLWTHWIKVSPFPLPLAEMTGWAGWALGWWCFGNPVARYPLPGLPSTTAGQISQAHWGQVGQNNHPCQPLIEPSFTARMQVVGCLTWNTDSWGSQHPGPSRGHSVLDWLAAALGSCPSKKTRPAWTALLPSLQGPAAWGACWWGSLPDTALQTLSSHCSDQRLLCPLPLPLGPALVAFHLNSSLSQSMWHLGVSASYFFQQMSFSSFIFLLSTEKGIIKIHST